MRRRFVVALAFWLAVLGSAPVAAAELDPADPGTGVCLTNSSLLPRDPFCVFVDLP